MTIYTGDVVEKALASGILEPGQPGAFGIAPGVPGGSGSDRPGLSIDALDSTNTPDPPAFYKHMLGWNRKALRIVLPNDAATVQINAAEELCAVAAQQLESSIGIVLRPSFFVLGDLSLVTASVRARRESSGKGQRTRTKDYL